MTQLFKPFPVTYCLHEYLLGVAGANQNERPLRKLVLVQMAEQHFHHSSNVLESHDNVIDIVQFAVLLSLVFDQQLIEQRITRNLWRTFRSVQKAIEFIVKEFFLEENSHRCKV